jgi:hypothetical protein
MNRWKFTIAILILLMFTHSQAINETETQREKMFHLIYEMYNSRPTPKGSWEKALSGRTSQSYNVMKGDTLWDISKTLFGDGFFWSKIWSLNRFITNPHQIDVGQTIYFYPGAGLEPPSIDVKKTPINPLLTKFAGKGFSTSMPPSAFSPPLNIASMQIPKSMRSESPEFKGFPGSIPEWSFAKVAKNKTTLRWVSLSREHPEAELSLTYFLTEMRVESKGFIAEVERGGSTASDRDFIFIEPMENLKVGDTYTVVKEIGHVKDIEDEQYSPSMIQIQGEVKIVGEVDGFYKAFVTKTIAPIEVDADIVKGTIPKFNMTDSGDFINQRATIIGGEFDLNRNLMCLQSIVFLNRGAKDGLMRGRRLLVNANHMVRNPASLAFDNSWTSAIVKVIRVEENYATAVVLTSSEMVTRGDFTGEPRKKYKHRYSPKDDFLEGRTEENFGDSNLEEDNSGYSEDF